jgi:hypothetical protein
MRPLSLILSVLAALTIAGCGSEDPGTGPVPDPVSNQQALELISACEVSLVVASHAGEVEVTLKEGERDVSVAEPDVDALFHAVAEAYKRSCDVMSATE